MLLFNSNFIQKKIVSAPAKTNLSHKKSIHLAGLSYLIKGLILLTLSQWPPKSQ